MVRPAAISCDACVEGCGAHIIFDDENAHSNPHAPMVPCSVALVPHSECAGASTECVAGDVHMDQLPCGPNSGVLTRTRTCSPTTCTWGGDTLGMSTGITAACSPGDKTGCPSGTCKNSAGNNTCPHCGQRVCQSNCTWSACESKGSCLDDHWQCCGSGRWRWCNPSTCNYNACDSCQGDADCTRSCGS